MLDPNDDTTCTKEPIIFMELKPEDRREIIAKLAEIIDDELVFVQGGRNRWPNRPISSYIDYENEDVELQDTRCGRFGLPLKFSQNTVNCHEEGECDNMCLSLNVERESLTLEVTIDKCSDWLLTVATNQSLRQSGCPKGYYRVEYYDLWSGNPNACFSIQMFEQPIPVADINDANVVENYCNGNLMPLTGEDDVFIFRQLSEQVGLTDGNHCLFGLTKNDIIEYSNWEIEVDVSRISTSNFNWDQTMNYSRIRDKLSYLVIKSNGQWTWAVDTISCIVCMFKIPDETPELRLNYDFPERKLELQMTHQEYLYREKYGDTGFICFAIIGQTYEANLTILPVANSNGKFVIEDVGTGQYWCTGHNLNATKFHSSEFLLAYGIVFAFQVSRNCSTTCSFSSFNDSNHFEEFFKNNFDFLLIKQTPSFELETIKSETEYMFIVHLTLTIQDDVTVDIDTNLVHLTGYQIETIFIFEKLKKMIFYNESSELNIISIKSTEYCLHESTLSIDAIIWRVAHIGETVLTSPLCPSDQNFTRANRTCSGDFAHGLEWKRLENATDCYTSVSESLLELYVNISNSNETAKVIQNVTDILQGNIQILLPMDIFLTSQILQKVGNAENMTFEDLENIFSIYNSLMQIDEKFLKISALFNSTNVLLQSLDNVLLTHIESRIADNNNYQKYGNVSLFSPLIETFIIDPFVSGASGVALYRPRNSSTSYVDFINYSSQFIDPNATIQELLANHVTDKDLIIGSYLPKSMLNILRNITVVLTVFFNDSLFQSIEDLPEERFFKTNGKVISITILGLDDRSNLPSEIPIFFKSNKIIDSKCGHWSLTASMAGWHSNGCYLKEIITNDFQRLAVCECSHLTHFGYLISSFMNDLYQIHEHKLTIITIIGSSFSLLGTIGIFLTAAVFPKWRKKLSSQILIHFAASISLEMFLMIYINLDECIPSIIANNKIACVALGSILHYSVLVMYFWMLIIAYFQFKRYVVVFNFNITHLLLKSTIIGWGVPLLPVITTLIADYTLYYPANEENTSFCYPTESAFYFGVVAPIALIFTLNSFAFLAVLVSIYRGIINSRCLAQANKFRMRLSQIRLSAFLFFTLGMTWIFGFLSKIESDCYLVFSYLFCITSTVQGLVLFLYFIVLDPYVRSLWLNYLGKYKCQE